MTAARRTDTTPTTATFPRPLAVERDLRSGTGWLLHVDGEPLPLSNLDKPYWAEEGYTKADLIAYYDNIAPWALPYVRDRPLTMKRMPEGADGDHFYAKQAPSHAPDWVATAKVTALGSGKAIDYVLAQDRRTLLWLANLGCIELHPWHARVDDLGHPDYALFDLDPMGVDFATVREVALLVRDACAHLGLRSYPRTSGATGMQVYVPLDRVHTAPVITAWVGRVCAAVHQADPTRTTMVWPVAERPAAVFLDHRMNTEGRNIAGTYSLRPERGATLAAPLTWEEVEAGAVPADFTITSIWDRLDAVGDLFAPVLGGGQDLLDALRAIGMDPEDQRAPGHAVTTPSSGRPAVTATPPVPPLLVLAPMLATSASAPFDDPAWVFEVKWDGVRAIATVERGSTSLRSRNGNDISAGYPELEDLWRRVDARNAVLDGEIVAFDDAGAPSFQRLQSRMHLREPAEVRRARTRIPVAYVAFDLLAVDGRPIIDRPLWERLEALDSILTPGAAVRRSDRFVEDGIALFDAAARRGLEGIMAKRLDSRYRPGARSTDWRKVKVRRRAQAVIGGWLAGAGGRSGDLGALLVGWYDAGGLRFAGRVGTGFDAAERRRLLDRLAAVPVCDRAPFVDAPRLAAATWVEPRLVCDVEYGELTDAGRIRAPSYKGLVADVIADEVQRPDGPPS